MKAFTSMMKNGTTALLLLAISMASLSSSHEAHATDAQPVGSKIIITPENLDTVLFGNNTDAIAAMNAVMKAKDQVNIARAALLPSLSLNVVLAIANTPMFLINSVSCLVPFIFPAGWYDYSAAKSKAGAEVMAFHIAKLNAYSQTYALAIQIGGDTEVLRNQEAHYARLQEYVRMLQIQADLGVIPQTDVMKGQIELGRIEMDLSRLRQLIEGERAAVRKLFGLKLNQDFDFQMPRVPTSPFEKQTAEQALPYIMARAPERRQVEMLIASTQASVKAAYWAFLGGCQGNQGSFSNSAANNTFNLSTGFSVNIGFGYFPRVSLAKHNVKDMELRLTELELELARILEKSVADITEVKIRGEIAQKNAELSERMLQEQSQLLPLGRVSVKEMLDTYSSISGSRTEGLSSRIGLDGHRITLKRVALEGGFLKVFTNSRRVMEIGSN